MNFVEMDGVIREKNGIQYGIKITGRDQGDREGIEIQMIEREAGIKESLRIVMDPKRKLLDENMGHGIG